jgi:hypothetical protein
MFILLVAALAGTAKAQSALPAGPIDLRPDKAVVYGADGEAMLIGNEDFLFTLAENPDRMVFALDPTRRRLRISPDGKKEFWLACADVRGSAGICPATPANGPQQNDGSRSGGPQLPVGRLPDCPGDPRCPQ